MSFVRLVNEEYICLNTFSHLILLKMNERFLTIAPSEYICLNVLQYIRINELMIKVAATVHFGFCIDQYMYLFIVLFVRLMFQHKLGQIEDISLAVIIKIDFIRSVWLNYLTRKKIQNKNMQFLGLWRKFASWIYDYIEFCFGKKIKTGIETIYVTICSTKFSNRKLLKVYFSHACTNVVVVSLYISSTIIQDIDLLHRIFHSFHPREGSSLNTCTLLDFSVEGHWNVFIDFCFILLGR